MSVDPNYDEAVEIVGACLRGEKCGDCDRCRMAERIASIIYSRNAALGPIDIEREACAKVADQDAEDRAPWDPPGAAVSRGVAEQIRARGTSA